MKDLEKILNTDKMPSKEEILNRWIEDVEKNASNNFSLNDPHGKDEVRNEVIDANVLEISLQTLRNSFISLIDCVIVHAGLMTREEFLSTFDFKAADYYRIKNTNCFPSLETVEAVLKEFDKLDEGLKSPYIDTYLFLKKNGQYFISKKNKLKRKLYGNELPVDTVDNLSSDEIRDFVKWIGSNQFFSSRKQELCTVLQKYAVVELNKKCINKITEKSHLNIMLKNVLVSYVNDNQNLLNNLKSNAEMNSIFTRIEQNKDRGENADLRYVWPAELLQENFALQTRILKNEKAMAQVTALDLLEWSWDKQKKYATPSSPVPYRGRGGSSLFAPSRTLSRLVLDAVDAPTKLLNYPAQ